MLIRTGFRRTTHPLVPRSRFLLREGLGLADPGPSLFNGRRLALGEPKTKKIRRTVRITQRAVDALTSHRKRQLEEKLRVGSLYRDQGLVFAG